MFRVLVCLTALVLAGCDSNSLEAPFVGAWRLAEVTTLGGVQTEGPIGSTLVFRRNGTFSLFSVNGCGGEYIARSEEVWLADVGCTLIGTDIENDLAQMLFLGGNTPGYEFRSGGDLYFKIYANRSDVPASVLSYYGLRFERE